MKIKEVLIKYRFIILFGLLLFIVGFYIGSYYYSYPAERLGKHLTSDYNCVIRFYRGFDDSIKDILEEDLVEKDQPPPSLEVSLVNEIRAVNQSIDSLNNLTHDYVTVKGEDLIDEKLDELVFFKQSYRDDILKYMKFEPGRVDFKGREDLIKLYLEVAVDLENIISNYYDCVRYENPEKEGVKVKSLISENGFWEDEKWYKTLNEMEEQIRESNFRERREEKLK